MSKQLSFIVFFIFASTAVKAYANLIVVEDLGGSVSAQPYLANASILNKGYKKSSISGEKRPIKIEQILYPNRSNLTYGKVNKKHLNIEHLPLIPIFVMGADEDSIKWAETNASYLKKIHAIGIITNIETKKRKKEITDKTGLFLINANANGLEDTLGVKHYPFLLYHNWIVQ